MEDIRKLRTRLFSRPSYTASSSTASSTPTVSGQQEQQLEEPGTAVSSPDSGVGRVSASAAGVGRGGEADAVEHHAARSAEDDTATTARNVAAVEADRRRADSSPPARVQDRTESSKSIQARPGQTCPELVVEEPTPDLLTTERIREPLAAAESPAELDQHTELPSSDRFTQSAQERWNAAHPRKQSLVDSANVHIIQQLLQETPLDRAGVKQEYFDTVAAAAAAGPTQPKAQPNRLLPSMLQRKIWVKRPGASATLVQVREDDLVDDVREHILRKYGNSLGRSFDAPDLTIRIALRAENGQRHTERVLGPEEDMCRTIDQAYPGGQTVDDALIIDIPHRRTPRPSPRSHYLHYQEETARPLENGEDYFPPMPPAASSPGNMTNVSHSSVHGSTHGSVHHAGHEHTRSMSVLNTGQVPPLPSPGGSRRAHHRNSRPGYARQHTASPTTATANSSNASKARPRHDSSASDGRQALPANAPMPSPSAQNHDGTLVGPTSGLANNAMPQSPRVSSPGPKRPKKARKTQQQQQQEQPGPTIPTTVGLDTSVPPINVLIVEDNHINLKLLEQFIRRLKVRWATAVNGREAVNKWREGGFHLVLMDIQLPIMSGLEATREIRRLERVNGVGVFGGDGDGGGAGSGPPRLVRGKSGGLGAQEADDAGEAQQQQQQQPEETKEEDRLDVERLFKSPVIIVALTASALQSDRHEALTAGCNDFLTKPVNFVWFERKVKEWGCMQALIDFDGWRKWKDFADAPAVPKVNGSVRDKAGRTSFGGAGGSDKAGAGAAAATAVGGAGAGGGGGGGGAAKKSAGSKPSAVSRSAAAKSSAAVEAAQLSGDSNVDSAGEGSRDESSSS